MNTEESVSDSETASEETDAADTEQDAAQEPRHRPAEKRSEDVAVDDEVQSLQPMRLAIRSPRKLRACNLPAQLRLQLSTATTVRIQTMKKRCLRPSHRRDNRCTVN